MRDLDHKMDNFKAAGGEVVVLAPGLLPLTISDIICNSVFTKRAIGAHLTLVGTKQWQKDANGVNGAMRRRAGLSPRPRFLASRFPRLHTGMT